MKENTSIHNKKYVLAVTIIIVIGILIRIPFFDYASADYDVFLSDWFNKLLDINGISKIGLSFGDYTCPYIYILSLLTYIPVSSLYSIKAVSCFFDFILAGIIYLIVTELTKNKTKSVVAFGVILLSPAVIQNSAVWAQCDSIFTSFIAISLLCIIKERPLLASTFFWHSFFV